MASIAIRHTWHPQSFAWSEKLISTYFMFTETLRCTRFVFTETLISTHFPFTETLIRTGTHSAFTEPPK